MFFRSLTCIFAMTAVLTIRAEPVSLGTGSQPRILSDGAQKVAVVFGRQDEILISNSLDGGRTFTPARTLARLKGMPLGMRRGPRVALTSKSMVVTAIEAEKGNVQDGDLVAWVSSDEGKSWEKSKQPLNSGPGAAREGLHGLASNRTGTVVSVWLDMRNTPKDRSGTEVWMGLSKDGGLTWQSDQVVYRHPGGSVCECCHPSVIIDDANKIHVMFRHAKDGARDMYLTSSGDQGKTFTEPQKLGRGTWPLNACPMDGGELILDANGGVHTTWMRDGSVFIAVPDHDEKQLGAGRDPVIVASSMDIWMGWNNGNILISKMVERSRETIGGRRSIVFCGWAQRGKGICNAINLNYLGPFFAPYSVFQK